MKLGISEKCHYVLFGLQSQTKSSYTTTAYTYFSQGVSKT